MENRTYKKYKIYYFYKSFWRHLNHKTPFYICDKSGKAMFKILPIKYSNLPFTILDKPEEKTVTEVPLRSFDLSDPFADPIEFSKQTNPTIKTADNVNNIEFIKSDAIYKLKLIIDSVNVENIRKSTPGSKARMVRDLATMLTLLTKIDVLPQFSFSKMDKSLKDSESQQRALEKEKEFSKDNW